MVKGHASHFYWKHNSFTGRQFCLLEYKTVQPWYFNERKLNENEIHENSCEATSIHLFTEAVPGTFFFSKCRYTYQLMNEFSAKNWQRYSTSLSINQVFNLKLINETFPKYFRNQWVYFKLILQKSKRPLKSSDDCERLTSNHKSNREPVSFH